ncbi:unnamed protein product [Lactuca virosa]|uniref:GAE domain-containing protein n=1 Tax=Lactuca virosa TaxID=75947 RepID=A0AAU9P6A4_9ASTR|nr:unnamed protein product [Lactuca virosa]
MASRSYDKVVDICDQLMLQVKYPQNVGMGLFELQRDVCLAIQRSALPWLRFPFASSVENSAHDDSKLSSNDNGNVMGEESSGNISRGRVDNNTFISTNPDVGIRKHKEEGFQRHTTSLLHLESASSNSLPGNGNGSITQKLRVTNTQHGKKAIIMRIRISYKLNNKDMLEERQISNIPREI